MSGRSVPVVYRVFFALLTFVAVIAQLTVHVGHGHSVVNFFSYFTNLSNIFAAVVLLIGAAMLLREPVLTDSLPYTLVRGASVVAMAVVGIVYGVLLRNEDLGSLMPWVNIVVHYVMPVAVVLDWFIWPPRAPLVPRQVGYWLLYPLAYLVYTFARGASLGWYPYPFLDPARAGGTFAVALYCLAIFVVFVVIGWVLNSVAGVLKRRTAAQPS